MFRSTGSYEPDLDIPDLIYYRISFRSTGSYEPDLDSRELVAADYGFDPQALTSLTMYHRLTPLRMVVSIHRLLRA